MATPNQAPATPPDESYPARATQHTATSAFNATTFLVNQILERISTGKLVEVMHVHPVASPGDDQPAGTVDVRPAVNQVDAAGGMVKAGTIYGIPYFRLQCGGNAIIMDPVAGDFGALLCCDRDISKVKNTQAQANPGSFRKFDPADGLYFGGFINGAATQEVRFAPDGIHVTSPHTIFLEGNVKITGNLEVDGTMNGGGGTGGKKVVLDGDAVSTGGTVIASSTKTRAN